VSALPTQRIIGAINMVQVVRIEGKDDLDTLHKDLVARMSDAAQNPHGDADWLCGYFPMLANMPDSRTFAAQIEGKNIALFISFEVRPTECFLNGLRTDPEYRRRGVSLKLVTSMDSQLAAAGMSVVRMGVASWNTPMLALAEKKLGLTGTPFCGIRCKVFSESAAALPVRTAGADDRDAIVHIALSDEMLSQSAGLVQCQPGQFCAASASYFEELIRDGHVHVVETDDGKIGAVAVVAPNRFQPMPSLNFIAGPSTEHVITLLSGLRRFAPKPSEANSDGVMPTQLFGYLPMESTAIKMVAAGKVDGWERHTTTYEQVFSWKAGGIQPQPNSICAGKPASTCPAKKKASDTCEYQ